MDGGLQDSLSRGLSEKEAAAGLKGALDALRNGLAAAIEDQLVRADRREISNVAGDVFRLAGEGSGAIRPGNAGYRRAAPYTRSSMPRNRASRLRSVVSAYRYARASLAGVAERRRRRRPGASRRRAGPCAAGRRGNGPRRRLASAASAPRRVRSGYRCTARDNH